MNELDSFTYLSYNADTSFFCKQKVFRDYPVEQLSTVNTEISTNDKLSFSQLGMSKS